MAHLLFSSVIFQATLILFGLTHVSAATVTYQFIEDETDTTLAFLELSSLPAEDNDVVSLTFTPAGDELFGYGLTYEGTFDTALASFVDNGDGFLVSSVPVGGANITDNNPPSSTTIAGDVLDFIIGTSDPLEPVDTMIAFLSGEPPVFALGSFVRVVPEPSSACLALIAMAALGWRRHRT